MPTLNALKNLGGGKGKPAQEQAAEIERLIAAAHEERSALGSMLTTLTARGAKLMPTGEALEQIKQLADGLDRNVQAIASRDELVSAAKARELAERIEQGIKQPLSKTVTLQEGKRTA